VTDISLMYTTIRTDENVEVRLPNNVVIQAAISFTRPLIALSGRSVR